MPILLAAALGDIAVLMTDGAGPGERIVPLRDNLALAVMGPQSGVDLAAAELRSFAPVLAPNLHGQLKRISFGAASHVRALDAAQGRPATDAKIGLLVAGFDAHGAFVAGSSHVGTNPKPESVLVRALDSVAFTVMGGEQAGAHAHFAAKLSALFPGGKMPQGDRAQLVSSLLDAGAETIRLVAPGPVPYRVLHRGQAAEAGAR